MGIRTGPGRCREARPMHLNRDWTMQECEGEGSPLLVHPRSWSACDCGPADLGMRVLSLVHPMCTWHACLARLALSVPLLVIALPAHHFQLRLGCAPADVHPELAVRACRRPSEALSRCRQSPPAQDHGTCDTPGSIEVHWAGSHRRWHSPRRDLSALGLAVPSMRALCCCTPQWRSPP